jgi:hypothetical protein
MEHYSLIFNINAASLSAQCTACCGGRSRGSSPVYVPELVMQILGLCTWTTTIALFTQLAVDYIKDDYSLKWFFGLDYNIVLGVGWVLVAFYVAGIICSIKATYACCGVEESGNIPATNDAIKPYDGYKAPEHMGTV